MAFVPFLRLKNIRKFLLFPCFVFGVVLLLLPSKGLQQKWKTHVKTTPYFDRGEYLWNKNNFNVKAYLKPENISIYEKIYKVMPLSMKDNYSKIHFISKEDKYLSYGFDIQASYNKPIGRLLPDTRHERCRDMEFDTENLFSSSIVISYHNEARSALLRTVASILLRTPPTILEEIILVDDNSDNAEDGTLLSTLPKVHIIRNERTEGVARSRIIGANQAVGDILVFLDSHCEVNTEWLEPLVDLLTAVPKALVSPGIDRIDRDNFEYEAIPTYFKGGFNWSLNLKWIPLTAHEMKQLGSATHPFWSPVVPGGMFAVSRERFLELGAYDSGLKSFGVEGIEISLKSWLCGGSVYVCPCSRIGYVFRNRNLNNIPFGSTQQFIKNAKRVAEVWMDEYKIFFYKAQPSAYTISIESLGQALAAKESMECKSFKWYLEGIYPELKLPSGEAIAYGQIKQGMRCLSEKHNPIGKPIIRANKSFQLTRAVNTIYVDICDERSVNQQGWTYSGRFKSAIYKSNKCLTAFSTSNTGKKRKNAIENKWKTEQLSDGNYSFAVGIQDCNGGLPQKWTRYGKLIYNNLLKLCLEICHLQKKVSSLNSPMTLCLSPCKKGHSTQLWEFTIEVQS